MLSKKLEKAFEIINYYLKELIPTMFNFSNEDKVKSIFSSCTQASRESYLFER